MDPYRLPRGGTRELEANDASDERQEMFRLPSPSGEINGALRTMPWISSDDNDALDAYLFEHFELTAGVVLDTETGHALNARKRDAARALAAVGSRADSLQLVKQATLTEARRIRRFERQVMNADSVALSVIGRSAQQTLVEEVPCVRETVDEAVLIASDALVDLRRAIVALVAARAEIAHCMRSLTQQHADEVQRRRLASEHASHVDVAAPVGRSTGRLLRGRKSARRRRDSSRRPLVSASSSSDDPHPPGSARRAARTALAGFLKFGGWS